MTDNNLWTSDIEMILENIRINSVILSKQHKKRYISLKNLLKYYRLPVIVISAFNSVIAIGAQPYLDQAFISLCNCGLALCVGVIGSIELFFGIDKQMENELTSSKDYYILSTNIFKMLSLDAPNRHNDGRAFLDEHYSIYIKLAETAGTLEKRIDDKLAPIFNGKVLMSSETNSEASTPRLHTTSSDGVLVDMDLNMNL